VKPTGAVPPGRKILVVDDDEHTRNLLRDLCEASGFKVVAATDGEEAMKRVGEASPDLVLLDLMMPRKDGFAVLKEIREGKTHPDLPVIILTAIGDIDGKIRGMELGADDYVTKPFSLRELMARIRAVLRRPGPRQKFEEFGFGDVRLHLRARQAFKGGREVRLTRKEFDLLRYLIEHPGEVITRDRLLDEVWGYERFPTTRTVDTHILRLRQKFEDDPERPAHILTAHGQGYRFVVERGGT